MVPEHLGVADKDAVGPLSGGPNTVFDIVDRLDDISDVIGTAK